ncbi:hypothetical protein ONR75_15695 [Rhodopseudomonas sp. P2A-2r]|uniref:hypothetical protein n=1 Tax=Rhodopseudomonas sp. P2A-2r TaxID=2991972 RepID=UPI0022340507|nr:hypothetical protein [Rhodopseudomonas sp. P2A-2r]UZE51876.1 hypothetical protein ONR75_15695 [Rhodopseudomonas sp. P2A-2r]
MAPNKANSLAERMNYAFGRERVAEIARIMLADRRACLLDNLTDDARDELLRRCMVDLKTTRKYAAMSRAHRRGLDRPQRNSNHEIAS